MCGTLCHCGGSRPEKWRKAGGIQEAVTGVVEQNKCDQRFRSSYKSPDLHVHLHVRYRYLKQSSGVTVPASCLPEPQRLLLASSDYSSAAELDNTRAECNQVGESEVQSAFRLQSAPKSLSLICSQPLMGLIDRMDLLSGCGGLQGAEQQARDTVSLSAIATFVTAPLVEQAELFLTGYNCSSPLIYHTEELNVDTSKYFHTQGSPGACVFSLFKMEKAYPSPAVCDGNRNHSEYFSLCVRLRV